MKRFAFVLLALVLVIGLCACGGGGMVADSGQAAHTPEASIQVRYDGFYVNDTDSSGHTLKVFRFYEDGNLIQTSVLKGTSENMADSLPDGDWFNRDNTDRKRVFVGTYTIDGTHITFDTNSSTGNVEYDGQVEETRLVVDVHSNINGNEEQGRVYTFIPFTQVPDYQAKD